MACLADRCRGGGHPILCPGAEGNSGDYPGLLSYQQNVQILGVGSESAEVETGSLPVLPLKSVKAVIETEAIVSATGSQTLGTAFAKGAAVLINEGDEPINVPKGTLLKTGEGVVFQTDEPVVVHGRSTEYFLDVAAGVRAGQKEVGITASEAGEKGNVAAGRIRATVPWGEAGRTERNRSGAV